MTSEPSAIPPGTGRIRRATSAALLSIVAAHPDPVQVNWSALDIDWFLATAEYHRVGTLIGSSVGQGAPLAVNAYLRMVSIRQRFRDGQIKQDLTLIRQVMERVDLPWAVLKGPALVASVYGGTSRDFRDLDLLVDGADLSAAIDGMERAGAKLVDRNFELMQALGSGEITLRMPSGTMLDLHWHPLHTRLIRNAFSIDVNKWMDRRVPFEFAGVEGWTLDPTDTVTYLCLHSCLSGAERLLWFKDIQVSLRAPWDVDRLVSDVNKTQVGLPVALMLERTQNLMGHLIDPAVLKRISSDIGWRTVGRILSRALPPHQQGGKLPDRTMFRSTRSTTWRSVNQLVSAILADSVRRHRADEAHAWRAFSWDQGNPLQLDIDNGSRDDFFAEVARAG